MELHSALGLCVCKARAFFVVSFVFRFFATFFEKKGGAKKLSKRKFLELHNALGLCVCRVRAFKVSFCLWYYIVRSDFISKKSELYFFEASVTLAFSCERRGTAQAVDE